MATDLKVQFFSHLNGLALGNNWGDLIRLLDTCLVNGLVLPSVTAARIDANGDINLTFFSAHNAVLFQIVELTGFSLSNINAKYRIKGLPTSTQMILKAELTGQSITANGSAKLSALGYDIIYRDASDVKRVYRAKNPRSEHPFIRVDETISDGTNTYNSAYAKSAMIGLIENMTHIDDYQDTSKLQLPLDTNDFNKNWKITGTGLNVVRGWSKWHWATDRGYEILESGSQQNGSRRFTLVGDADAFYLLYNSSIVGSKRLNGCGLFKDSLENNHIPNWFLMSCISNNNASQYISSTNTGFFPLFKADLTSRFFTTSYDVLNQLSGSVMAIPVLPNFSSGGTNIFNQTNVPALEIPFYDSDAFLRGSLHHVYFAGKNINGFTETKPILTDNSMYVADSAYLDSGDNFNFVGGLYFYLGELE